MEDIFSIPVNSDSKHGLGLLPSDLDTFQFPSFCEGEYVFTGNYLYHANSPIELDHEQLLALDGSEGFYLDCADVDVYRTNEEALSRTSTVITPQSECSTRTTVSARAGSPTSDIIPYYDGSNSADIETMYHDTTQSIVSGRQSRAASTTWSHMTNGQIGLNGTLTPQTRSTSHRPQSFAAYRTPQTSQQDRNNTPPAPSSFFSSPNLTAQNPSRSPYITPSLNSPMMPQLSSLPTQTNFFQGGLSLDPSTYYAQAQQGPQQQFYPTPTPNLQQAFQLQQDYSRRASQQLMASHLFPPAQQLSSRNVSPATSTYASSTPPTTYSTNSDSATNALPNTTGNSSTGYQCFSHGCGGRHFSNWGNLVRHHRERQLRSKQGAKPTCPRCSKGFTRSSARDAHVAGLKCVLGRRRRGAGGVKANSPAEQEKKREEGEEEQMLEDGEEGSDGRSEDADSEDGDEDRLSLRRGSTREGSASVAGAGTSTADVIDASFVHLGGGIPDHSRGYMAPQQLQFEI